MFTINASKIVSSFLSVKSMYFITTQKIQDISDLNCYPMARILVYVLLTLKNILCTSASTEVTHQSHCIFFLTVSHEMSAHRKFSVLWTVTLYHLVRLIQATSMCQHMYVCPDPLRLLKNLPLSKLGIGYVQ